MAVFIFVIALLLLVTVAVLVLPLLRAKTPDSVDRQAVNLAIAKQRLRELSRELEIGTLGEEAYGQAKGELELTLAGDLDDSAGQSAKTGGRWMAPVVLVLVPVLAAGLYVRLGSPLFLDEQAMAQNVAEQAQAASEVPPEIADLIKKLEQRMEDAPDDAQGQRLLIRTYMSQQRYTDAVTALESWGARDGDNPDLMVMLADATSARAGGRLLGEPTELLRRSLALNPEHRQALWVIGYAEAQSSNFLEAIKYWQRLLPLVSSDANAKRQVTEMIREMQQLAGVQPSIQSADKTPATSVDVGPGLTLEVSLDPLFAEKVSPDDAVFIYAKTPTGPPMPLAVVKHKVSDLPLVVTLDDSTAMIPTHLLSSQSSVTVGARVSLSGAPVAQAGDYYIEMDGVETPSDSAVKLVINELK